MNITQVGGDILGAGKYGCVFMPPLLCEGETKTSDDNKVSKLLLDKDAEEELKIATVLRRIPFSKNYFIYPEVDTACKPAPLEEQREPDLSLCDLVDKKAWSSMRIFKMPNGGLTLQGSEDLPSSFDWWAYGKHLLEGLTLLIVHGVVHGDLHDQNMLIDDYYVPRIIDFGQSYRIQWASDQQLSHIIYYPHLRLTGADNDLKYVQLPPEYLLFSGEKLDYDRDMVINAILDSRKRSVLNRALLQLFGLGREDLKEQMLEFEASSVFFKAAKTGGGIKWLRSQGLYKHDAWSIGYYFATRYSQVDRQYGILSQPKYATKKEGMLAAIRGLCNLNPLKRLTAPQALALWDGPNNAILQRFAKGWY